MPNRFPPVRINLVEQKGWEPWDWAGRLSERASDAAHEDYSNLDEGRLIDFLRDMAGDDLTKGWTGPKEWSPRKKKISDEEFEWLSTQLEGTALENTRYAILDAMTWMYEEAMTPSNVDIRDAILRMKDFARSHFDVDEELWEPIVGEAPGLWFENQIAEELSDEVQYLREDNHYDRFLVFTPALSEVVQDLIEKSPWPKKKLYSRLETQFRSFQEWYLDHFWDAVHKEFDDVDITNRTRWSKHWNDMLNFKAQMVSVRKEMVEAVKSREASDG